MMTILVITCSAASVCFRFCCFTETLSQKANLESPVLLFIRRGKLSKLLLRRGMMSLTNGGLLSELFSYCWKGVGQSREASLASPVFNLFA